MSATEPPSAHPTPAATAPAEHLARTVELLVRQVAHWQPGRWVAGTPGAGPATRADRVYALVQRLADLAAEIEGRPRRAVPRLADPVLSDQVRVMADDLLAASAGPDVLARAAGDVDAVRRTL